METWQKSFLDKLGKAQTQWLNGFEDTLDSMIGPVFDDMSAFVRDNGFRVTTPLSDAGRRSYKFELAENAYLLMIFKFTGVGEFELRCESFVPSSEPVLSKAMVRVADIDEEWARKQFQQALDNFVEALAGSKFKRNSPVFAEV